MNDEEVRQRIIVGAKNLETGFKGVFKFNRKKIMGGK